MKTFILSFILITLITISSIAQDTRYSQLHPLSGKWAITVEGGVTLAKTDFNESLVDYYSRLMGEYFFQTKNPGIFGLRLFGSFGNLKGSGGASSSYPPQEFKTSIIQIGGGLNYAFAISDAVIPYLYAGASYLSFDPMDFNGNKLPNNEAGKYSNNLLSLQGEFGIKFLLSENFGFNFNGAVNYEQSDELDDIAVGLNDDIYFTFIGGLSFYFGGQKDSDMDGIMDEDDACPETPQGVRVDNFGCPIDSDKDGVPDYLDRCANSPANVIVDASGCPRDSDLDGVADYLDQCSQTPPNVKVDIRGCPLDEDFDGVPDFRDMCLGTPVGIEVDKFGCQIESQEEELPDISRLVLEGEVNFEIGKSELLPAAIAQLGAFIKILKEYTDSRWRIEGHTDNTGSYNLNMKISSQRAISVAEYLIDHGIDNSRLEIFGYGPDYPVGDNSTQFGRALNRRVTIEIIDGADSKEQKRSKPPVVIITDTEYNVSIERNVGNMIYTDGKFYSYQVSSWRTNSKAQSEVNRLRERGFNAFVVEAKNIPDLEGTWYRVRIGYFHSLIEARENKAAIIE